MERHRRRALLVGVMLLAIAGVSALVTLAGAGVRRDSLAEVCFEHFSEQADES